MFLKTVFRIDYPANSGFWHFYQGWNTKKHELLIVFEDIMSCCNNIKGEIVNII